MEVLMLMVELLDGPTGQLMDAIREVLPVVVIYAVWQLQKISSRILKIETIVEYVVGGGERPHHE